MSNLSVLVIEDDIAIQKSYNELNNSNTNLDIIGITSSSTKALEIVTNLYPDAIILDLELHNGEGNGLNFLENLKSTNYKPFILIVTNNSSQIMHNILRENGADFIISKHQQDYSEKMVLDFLLSIKNHIQANIVPTKYEFESSEAIDLKNKEIHSLLLKEFTLLGMSNKYSGKAFLYDAIKLKIHNFAYDTKTICKIIASSYNKKESNVSHAMQNAIDKTWNTSDPNDLIKYFTGYVNPDRESPTLSEFINFYAEKLRPLIKY